MRVLITGAAGYVGRLLVPGLEREHELRLGDVSPLDDPRWVEMDVTDPHQVERAVAGMNAVVHLAIAGGHEGPWEDADFNQTRFDVNVRGTYNVLAACVAAGVQRLVCTSSLMVVWGYEPPQWVDSSAPPRPVGTYALTKQLCEAMCEHFARAAGLSTVCLRIPKPVDVGDPTWKDRRLRPQWLASPDLIQAYAGALAAPGIGFEIVTLVGESSRRRWDLSKAHRVLGYRPTCRLEDMGYTVGDEEEPLTADGLQ